MKYHISTMVLIFLSTVAFALDQNQIEGIWKIPQDGTLIQIVVKDDVAQGFIVKRPDGKVGEVDKYNSKPELRSQPILGLKIFRGNRWSGGTAYDPDSGHSYHAKAKLIDSQTLAMHGYIHHRT
jgi:uncharacterized protein (DUF2147 family)